MAAEGADLPDALYLVFNGGAAISLRLPETAAQWRLILDTTRPGLTQEVCGARLTMPAQSVHVFEPLSSGAEK